MISNTQRMRNWFNSHPDPEVMLKWSIEEVESRAKELGVNPEHLLDFILDRL